MKILLPIFVLSVFLFSRCAQQTSPTGGYKDLQPPILDTIKGGAYPANFTTNFSGNEITLQFNEYVQLDKPKENIVVSPSLSKDPQYQLKGKKLVISLPEDLESNTTYTINMGSSIKDLTEGNVMQNFSYVFSTGSYIDSLSAYGKVFDAETKQPVEGATVMLYRANEDDSVVVKQKPLYFTKTNISGNYKLDFLHEGKYRCVAILDENTNLKWNNNENIGFLENEIEVSLNDSLPVDLSVSKLEKDKQTVLQKSYSKGKIELAFQLPSDTIIIEGLDTVLDPKNIFFSHHKDTVSIWLNQSLKSRKKINLVIKNDEHDYFDTIKVPLSSNSKLPDLLLPVWDKSGYVDINENPEIHFSKPIQAHNSNNIFIISKGDTIETKVNEVSRLNFKVIHEWEEGEKYSLFCPPGAFKDIYGNRTDTLKRTFTFRKKEDYGTLFLKISLPDGNYKIQVFSASKTYFNESFSGSKFDKAINFLPPGDYGIKVIFDENKDQKWNSGNYWLKEQPERIEFYNKPLSIRPGWDLDVSWEITE